MKKLLLLWFIIAIPAFGFAQFTVSGKITDADTQKPLIGATVVVGRTGTTTDAQGNYYLTQVAAGAQLFSVSYVGFVTNKTTLTVTENITLDVALQATSYRTEEVIVSATRANEKTGTTFTNVTKEQIQERNFGQDLPYLLEQTPSVVVNSDAGAGVGYTGIRIRGSDITRINVTVNGIPINDSESHGTFFVNMPDLASSIQDIQVQRGVGTSTNGAAAFGASLNIRTLGFNQEAYAEAINTIGSFDTRRHTLNFGTGLIKDKFTFDGRLSKISSDGYIDRAFSDLKSYYFSAGYLGKTGMLRFVTFSGKEKTYQAWYGVPENKLETDRTYNPLTYENETDNYQQDHYQLHYSKNLAKHFDLGGAFHFTHGSGYYEQYRKNQRLSNYKIAPVVIGNTTISRSDLIRQRWLDNDFYGATYALNYNPQDGRLNATLGGAWNHYDGDHFGEVTWARYASTSEIRHRYYEDNALKTDFNIYGKVNYQLTPHLGLFGDLQYRTIDYKLRGAGGSRDQVNQQADFKFFNPKGGVTYALSDKQTFYASYAVGNREPVRSDFVNSRGNEAPKAETMYNLEAGYRLRGNNPVSTGQRIGYRLDANYYYMDYKNQLVLTGQLNDVGASLRTNIEDSYRTGVELAGLLNLADLVNVNSSVGLSRNKIRNYTQTVYIYDANYTPKGTVENTYSDTDISFSPSLVTAHTLEVQPLKGLKAALLYKTVSKQYLDNTGSELRKINGYQVTDLRLRYVLKPNFMRELELAFLLNNLFNARYEANGYTYSEQYVGDATRHDFNFYFPQATRNFLLTLGLRF